MAPSSLAHHLSPPRPCIVSLSRTHSTPLLQLKFEKFDIQTCAQSSSVSAGMPVSHSTPGGRRR